MPTALEFDLAARQLEDSILDFGPIRDALGRLFGPETVAGGRLTPVLAATRSLGLDTFSLVALELDELARQCEERAEACRSYEAALADYRSQLRAHTDLVETLPSGEPRPSRPEAPHKPTWIEV